MFNVLVVVFVALQRAVGDDAVPQNHRVHDGLAVDGAADGRNDVLVLRPVGVPEVEQDAAIVAGLHAVDRVVIVVCKVLRILGGQQRQIQLAGLHLHGLSVVVGHDLEDDALDLGRALEVVLVAGENDGLALVPALQPVGAGADGTAEEGGGLHVLALQQVLGQDCHGHVVQEGRVGGGQAEGDGVLVDHRDLRHVLVVGGVFGAVLGIHDGLDGELHVLGGEIFAVVPLHVLLQMEGVGEALFIVVPGLRQAGYHLIVAVVGGQAVEDQDVDLAVLVHGRVDAGVVAGRVGQRVVARLRRRRTYERQRKDQQQAQKSLHLNALRVCFSL